MNNCRIVAAGLTERVKPHDRRVARHDRVRPFCTLALPDIHLHPKTSTVSSSVVGRGLTFYEHVIAGSDSFLDPACH